MTLIGDLEKELARLEAHGLLRARTRSADGAGDLVDVCSNDYLGYARRGVSRETLVGDAAGAGASRLIFGTAPAHDALEQELCDWLGAEDSLLFSSGYAANVGVVSALARQGDLIVSDALNHASLIDGCRLSRARVVVVPHLDLAAVGRALREPTGGRRWVVTESCFSMDGDSPDLVALRSLCDAHGAGLILDEAHALGVFGSEGGGLAVLAGINVECRVGTFGKALGVQGAFAAGPGALIRYLWNRARPFVFSTATSPLLTTLTLERVRSARADEPARARLRAATAGLEHELRGPRLRLPPRRQGPIFPIVLGSPERAVAAAAGMAARGFRVQPIRPPTVPSDGSRLRVTVNATLTNDDVARLGAALREVCTE